MYTDRFGDALKYAHELHRDQFRKGTRIPYISHLLIVVGLVVEQGADEDTAIAAVLHDAVEDAGGAPLLDTITRRFGGRVAGFVNEVSDTDQDPKPPWRERKERYLASISAMSPEALLIAVADKLHNNRNTLADSKVSDEVWTRFNANREEQAWFHHRFLAEVEAREDRPRALVAELRRVDEELYGHSEVAPL